MDERLGNLEVPPLLCAVSKKPVAGMPQVQIDLGGGYYCAVLSKKYTLVTDELIAELKALIPATPEETPAERKPKKG